MIQSKKLSLFFGLGCEPMVDVILHTPNWTIHTRDTIHRLEQSSEVRRAIQHDAELIMLHLHEEAACNNAMSIEAIPYRLTHADIETNIHKIHGRKAL